MELGALELHIFVSLVVILGAAFVALICDFLKGNNEQLREHNIELRVRQEEQERFLGPVEQYRARVQHRPAPQPLPAPQRRPVARPAAAVSAPTPAPRRPAAAPTPAPMAPAPSAPPPRPSRPAEAAEAVPALIARLEPIVPLPARAPQPRPLALALEPIAFGAATPVLPAASGLAPVPEPVPESAPQETAEPASDPQVVRIRVIDEEEIAGAQTEERRPFLTLVSRQETPAAVPEETEPKVEAAADADAVPEPPRIEEPPFVLPASVASLLKKPAAPDAPEPAAPGTEPVVEFPLAAEAAEPVHVQAELPAGFHEASVLAKAIDGGGSVSGLLVAIGINDFAKLFETDGRQAGEEAVRAVTALVESLIGPQDFACRYKEDEYLLFYRGESGATAQRRLGYISERLWDFQLRSLGSLSILFSWGGFEANGETLGEAVDLASERMHQTRRSRKTVSMDTVRPRRRAVNE